MRVVALISGGKDSCYNMMQCVAAGHEIVALANLQPETNDEIDSYMYQTVGHDGIYLYSKSMNLPLYRRVIVGNAVVKDKDYSPTAGDEVEDLFCLLSEIKNEIDFEGVSVGAILSDYQRVRVENVCTRLGCVSLAYLWRRDQSELLQEMIDCGINAIIIKTASLGLLPDVHLGQSLSEMQAHLQECKGKYGVNVCGEGGEYETFTLDCPLFQQSIILDEYEKVIHSNDAFAPVGYLKLKKMHLVKKTAALKGNDESEIESVSLDDGTTSKPESDSLDGANSSSTQKEHKDFLPVKTPLDYIADLVECTKANCCDGHVELCKGSGGGDGEISHEFCCSAGAHTEALNAEPKEAVVEDDIKNEESSATVIEKTEEVVAEDVSDSTCQNIRETLPLPVCLRVTFSSNGWFWAMGINGKSEQNEDSTDSSSMNPMWVALSHLKSILEEHGMHLEDLIGICMYVHSMDDYAQYNKEYIKFFASKPPVRVCVEAPLPVDTPILLEAVAYLPQAGNDGSTRQCMHVQGISHWAPANIGPYSQAIWVGDIIYVAGQIGLIPGSMTMVQDGARMECKLALRHVNRIMKATDSKLELRDVVQGICFVTDIKYIEECRQEWEKRTNNAIVEYFVVPRLPRDARVEWQIWAHKHNTAFEYEETGCYVGSGVKVRIIRRWNYENRVSAIVCRASITKEEASFGIQEMKEMTEYAISKLLREGEKSVECSLRVFYKTGDVNPSDIFNVLDEECSKYAIAFSILPVCSLVMETTVVSLCGVRH